MTYLAVAAVFRNEAPYLKEWIEFHRRVGVERFFLYDNGSTDAGAEIVEPYVATGIADLIEWPGEVVQSLAYEDALYRYRKATRWLAFIDIDEFLFSPTYEPLPSLLERFEPVPAVAVNWCVFGPSGRETKPEGLVIENYTRRAVEDNPINRHVKSIVDPRQTVAYHTPHSFQYVRGLPAYTERFKAVHGPLTRNVSFDLFRVNHYWTKSVEECRRKFERGRADTGEQRAWREFEQARDDLDAVEDTTIVPYAAELLCATCGQIVDELYDRANQFLTGEPGACERCVMDAFAESG